MSQSCTYEAKPEHFNSFDVTHGGASMTLLDVAMATAARSETPDMGVVTIEMKTSFMQPAIGPAGGQGRLIHRTATLAFTEGSVYDAAGRICSHATGTFSSTSSACRWTGATSTSSSLSRRTEATKCKSALQAFLASGACRIKRWQLLKP